MNNWKNWRNLQRKKQLKKWYSITKYSQRYVNGMKIQQKNIHTELLTSKKICNLIEAMKYNLHKYK